jgi:hypothetical protein
MDALIHITLNSGDARISPRSDVRDDVVAMIKPVVAAGGGELAGLHITMEAADIFTLGWQPDTPVVRCYLAKEPNPALWKQTRGEGSEPTGPWRRYACFPARCSAPTSK